MYLIDFIEKINLESEQERVVEDLAIFAKGFTEDTHGSLTITSELGGRELLDSSKHEKNRVCVVQEGITYGSIRHNRPD